MEGVADEVGVVVVIDEVDGVGTGSTCIHAYYNFMIQTL